MSRLWSLETIRYKVDDEGLGYCIEDYLDASSIEDSELARLWEAAYKALTKVREYLDENCPPDEDDISEYDDTLYDEDEELDE